MPRKLFAQSQQLGPWQCWFHVHFSIHNTCTFQVRAEHLKLMSQWRPLQDDGEEIPCQQRGCNKSDEELRLFSWLVFGRLAITELVLEDVFNHDWDVSERRAKNHTKQRPLISNGFGPPITATLPVFPMLSLTCVVFSDCPRSSTAVRWLLTFVGLRWTKFLDVLSSERSDCCNAWTGLASVQADVWADDPVCLEEGQTHCGRCLQEGLLRSPFLTPKSLMSTCKAPPTPNAIQSIQNNFSFTYMQNDRVLSSFTPSTGLRKAQPSSKAESSEASSKRRRTK